MCKPSPAILAKSGPSGGGGSSDEWEWPVSPSTGKPYNAETVAAMKQSAESLRKFNFGTSNFKPGMTEEEIIAQIRKECDGV